MNDEISTYRAALNDSSHPFYEATWLIFADSMNTKYAAKKLAPKKDALIPYLLEIVDNEDLREVGSLGKGYAPPHAIQLLGEWEVTEAGPRLLHIFEHDKDEEYDMLIDAVSGALEKMGSGIVDDLLQMVERLPEGRHWEIAAILSQTGRGQQHVFDWIAERFLPLNKEWDVRIYAECLLECDKEQAIPLLEAQLKKGRYEKNLRLILKNWIEQYRQKA